jgi:ABC-2 type transport system permease protein
MDALRLYGRYIGVSIRGQMQYRGSFIMLSLGNFLGTGVEFLGIWVLFDRFGTIRGWTLPEAAMLYGMANVAFALAESVARGFDLFPMMVKYGDFDRLLLRPRSTVLQLMGTELQLTRIGRLAQGMVVLLWATSTLQMDWSPAKVGLAVTAVLGGVCMFSGLFVIQATIAFWTIETLELMNTVTYGGVEAAQFPLTIYRPWFQRFFTFIIPVACLNYFPAVAILGRADALGTPVVFQWISPVIGGIFLLATLQVWRIGVRHYASTGS